MEFPGSLNRWYVIYNHPLGNIYHLYFLLGDYISHTTYYIREPETAIENLPKFTMESLSFYKLLISRHTIYYVLRKRPSCSTVYETEHSFSKCSTLLNYIYILIIFMICSVGKKHATFPLLKYPAFLGPGGFRKQLKPPPPSPHVRTPFCRWPESWGPERGPLVLIGGGKGLVVGGGLGPFKNGGGVGSLLGKYIYITYINIPKVPLVCLKIPGLTRTNPMVEIGLGPSNLGKGMDP